MLQFIAGILGYFLERITPVQTKKELKLSLIFLDLYSFIFKKVGPKTWHFKPKLGFFG
jgi:hypothetical protein